VLVNTPPIRPLIVLSNIVPGIGPSLLKRLGYSEVFRKTADFEDASRRSSGR
jgi:hypothetical protein